MQNVKIQKVNINDYNKSDKTDRITFKNRISAAQNKANQHDYMLKGEHNGHFLFGDMFCQ